jgi:hypothetical protein
LLQMGVRAEQQALAKWGKIVEHVAAKARHL